MFPLELAPLIQFIGYPGIAAIIFAETGTIIGFFLPGASLLFTAGLLSSQGILDIRFLILVITIAAILGDNVGYWFGAKVGIHAFDKPNALFFKHSYLERTRRFYATYGARMILFARFIPMVRTFAPILAGVAGMDYRMFMFYNVLGAVLWATSILSLGYLLGDVFPRSADYLELGILAVVVASSIPFLFGLIKKRRWRTVPHVVFFDLDGTLSAPHSEVPASMRERLEKLLETRFVVVLSGATFERISASLSTHLSDSRKEHMFILSVNGAIAHVWKNGAWQCAYDESLSTNELETIRAALIETISALPEFAGIQPHGDQIIERGGYVAFTAPGVSASHEHRIAWDPSALKRRGFIKHLQKLLPGYDVYIGGHTTVDIMRKGFNKAYGVRWVLHHLSLQPTQALFVGDALYPGGNDYPVISTGVLTTQVSDPTETQELVDELLKELHSDTSRT